MKLIPCTTLVFATILCATTAALAQGYSSYPPQSIVTQSVPMQQAPMAMNASAKPYCREYQQTITIVGKTQKGYGTACLQPDGSWQLMPPENQPAPNAAAPQSLAYMVRENQVYLVPPEPFVFFEFGGGRHYYPPEYTHYYPGYHWRH